MKKNKVYEAAIEYMKEELLDINEQYTPEVVAQSVTELIEALRPKSGYILEDYEVKLADLRIKAHNVRRGSWLSVSDGEATGVARSMVFMVNPFYRSVNLSDVSYTLDMINEAWYTLKN